MDRNSIIGILLIGALLIGYSIVTRPSEEELAERRRIQDSIQQVDIQNRIEAEKARIELESLKSQSDSASTQPGLLSGTSAPANSGVFTQSAQANQSLITLENEYLRLQISPKGGHVYSAELKEYKTWDQKPLILFEGEENIFDLKFYAQNQPVFTKDLVFEPQSEGETFDATNSAQTLTMRLNAGENQWMDFVYTLEPGSYELGFEIKLNNMNQVFGRNTPFLDLDWSYPLRQQEKGAKFASQYSSIYYKYYQDETGHLQSRKVGDKDLTTKVEWIGFKQQFFSSVLRANEFFSSAKIVTSELPEGSGYLKLCEAAITIPITNESVESVPMTFAFVPNHFKTLKKIGYEYQDMVDLGWPFISWINKLFVVNIFHYLEGVFNFPWKYGLIIFLLTIFFKSILLPLSYRSYVSGAKMRVLKPQIEEINAKFPKEKAMERQQATMALYKKAGVNPMGGCLPMLLQMPIWLALFRFFPASIELRQQSFLWAKDLSSYDSIIDLPFEIPMYGDHISLFTLLMAVSMILTTKINMSQTDTGQQQMPGMKVMMYMMPVMMLLWFNSYASGLSFYYFISNIITFLQMYLIRRNIDEEKILKKLNANQKKPQKKRSTFQSRLEKMARERQQLNSKGRK
jgi:YidC/Oxa1 family membrane protein insertase